MAAQTIILGDFNMYIVNPSNTPGSQVFGLLSSNDLVPFTPSGIYAHSYTLDLVSLPVRMLFKTQFKHPISYHLFQFLPSCTVLQFLITPPI